MLHCKQTFFTLEPGSIVASKVEQKAVTLDKSLPKLFVLLALLKAQGSKLLWAVR